MRRRPRRRRQSAWVTWLRDRLLTGDLRIFGIGVEGRYLATAAAAVLLGLPLVLSWQGSRLVYDETRGTEVVVDRVVYPVSRWEGAAAPGEPLAMHACFVIEAETLEAPVEPAPKPPEGPGWLKCYNARFLAEELARGAGVAYVAEAGEFDGIDRIVAILPGGRGFMWRQPGVSLR